MTTTPNARVILPADATVEMIAAFWRQKNTGTQDIGEAGDATSDFDAYTAMLTAAPASGKVTEAELEKMAEAIHGASDDCHHPLSEDERDQYRCMASAALSSLGLTVEG